MACDRMIGVNLQGSSISRARNVLFSFTFLISLLSLKGSDQQCREGGVICEHMGVCEEHIALDGTLIELCKCQQQFSGRTCEFPNSVCKYSCKHGSICAIYGCGCTNTSLYSGKDCSKVHCIVDGKITPNYCKNGGICYKGDCVCPNNTTGSHCELITCGAYTCLEGYCSLDQCICDVPCTIGCDQTTGLCKTEPATTDEQAGLSAKTKVLIGAIAGVVTLVIIPALYAMYNMSIEHAERNRRLRSQLHLEKITHAAYLEQEQQKRAQQEVKAKSMDDKSQRKLAKQRRKTSFTESSNTKKPSLNIQYQTSNHSLGESRKATTPSPTRSRGSSKNEPEHGGMMNDHTGTDKEKYPKKRKGSKRTTDTRISTDKVESTKPTDKIESTKPTDKVESTKPTAEVESTKPTDKVESTKPTDKVESTKPTDKVESIKPTAEVESSQQLELAGQSDSATNSQLQKVKSKQRKKPRKKSSKNKNKEKSKPDAAEEYKKEQEDSDGQRTTGI